MNDNESLHTILRAVAFAARSHAGQVRKDGRTPYVSHVMRVATIVQRLFGHDDPDMATAALLHDTIEDTNVDFDEIAETFSPHVAQWVALLSKDKRLEDAQREDAYLKQLLAAEWQVQVCKLADVYDNLLDMENLKPGGSDKVLKRTRHYLDGLATIEHPSVKKAWSIVDALWQKRHAESV